MFLQMFKLVKNMCVFLLFIMGRLSLLTYDYEFNNLNDATGNIGLLFYYYLLPSFFFSFCSLQEINLLTSWLLARSFVLYELL